MNIRNLQEKIDSLARFFLYILIFWLPFGSAVVESCVVTVFFLWVIKKSLLIPFGHIKSLPIKRKAQEFFKIFQPKNSFLNIPIAVFLYICLLSALWSRAPLYSLHGLISKTLEWFVVYFLILEFLSERKHIFIFLGAFLSSAAFVCLDGISQLYLTGYNFSNDNGVAGRASSCFSTGNDLGGYLLFPLFLSASFLLFEEDKRKKIFFGLIFILTGWAMAITLSRGAWLATFFGMCFLGMLGMCLFLFFRKSRFLRIIILFLALASLCLFLFFSPDTRQKMRIDSGGFSQTMNWRENLWIDSLKMIRDRPLLGHGSNTFMQTFREKQYRRRVQGIHEYSPTYAHNCYIQTAAEVGLLGLGCFLWILSRFFKNIFSIILDKRAQGFSVFKIILSGLAVGSLSFCLHSFVDTDFYSLKLSILFWCMIGISVSIYKLLSQPQIYDIK